MSIELERRADGLLWARRGEQEASVSVHRCFPWSEPTRFVSLRDDEKEEFALVADPADLGKQSREALERALAEAGFVMQIKRILEVHEEIEIRSWKVETEQGARTFQTRLDDWPRDVPGGGFLVRDVAGDLYHIRDARDLDARSRELLWAYVE